MTFEVPFEAAEMIFKKFMVEDYQFVCSNRRKSKSEEDAELKLAFETLLRYYYTLDDAEKIIKEEESKQ